MGFDVEKLADYAGRAIQRFAQELPNEKIYAFAIDDGLICFNSVAAFAKNLAEYQEKYPGYEASSGKAISLRASTGDWEWQGFDDLRDAQGWDEELSEDHYNYGLSDPGEVAMNTTPYALAMTALLSVLEQRRAFDALNRTEDFTATWCNHSY